MSAVFTTTIAPETLDWIKQQAKEEKITIRSVIEKAVELYQVENKKKLFAETFIRANDDQEMIDFAWDTLEDSNEQFILHEHASS